MNRIHRNLQNIIYRYVWEYRISLVNKQYHYTFYQPLGQLCIRTRKKADARFQNRPFFFISGNHDINMQMFIWHLNVRKMKMFTTLYKTNENYWYTSTASLRELKDQETKCLRLFRTGLEC